MAQPRLITEYEAVLFAELPAALAEEVSDGLQLAYDTYLRRGLAPGEAAAAAVAEFGDACVVVEAFSRASPAGRLARVLVATGPLVGLCWATELIAGRAWDWPVPGAALARLRPDQARDNLRVSGLERILRVAVETGGVCSITR